MGETLKNIVCGVGQYSEAKQAQTAEWIKYWSDKEGTWYYNKNKIKKDERNNIWAWMKIIYNEDGKKKAYSFLKSKGKAPNNPDMISHWMTLMEFDCPNEKYKFNTMTFYFVGSGTYSMTKEGEWKYVYPNSMAEKASNIICGVTKKQ